MKVYDLSHDLNGATPVYPGDDGIALVRNRELSQHGYTGYRLTTQLHTGTHVDAPMHMVADARTIDLFPLNRFMGRGVLLDVRGEDVICMRESFRTIVQAGDVPLLFTGFDRFYHEHAYFTEHPVITQELASFFAEAGIAMLGMDLPAPDRYPFVPHHILLSAGVLVLENLTNLASLVDVRNFEVFAVPLRIAAEASLVRAFARSGSV